MGNPKVTVLMPVFNDEKYLKQSIASILNQTFRDFEFLIIEDASTDKSAELIKTFKDRRIKVLINKKNLGISSSLNKGLKIAKGEYIARMDADDISLPRRLEKQVKFMDRNPDVGICGSWVKLFGKGKGVLKYPSDSKQLKVDLLFFDTIMHPTVILRKKMFQKFNLRYNAKNRCLEDYELFAAASRYFPLSNIKEVLLRHRAHSLQACRLQRDAQMIEAQIIQLKQLRHLGLEPTRQELDIHNSKMGSNLRIDLNFIQKAERWFCKILYANRKKRIYDKKILLSAMGNTWLVMCRQLPRRDLSLKVIDTFLDSPLSKGIDLKAKAKFVASVLKRLRTKPF